MADGKVDKGKRVEIVNDDEPDEWFVDPSLSSKVNIRLISDSRFRDKRIFSTGCAVENAKMTDCYYEKKDWRVCKKEMEAFRECWKRNGNVQRTEERRI